MWTIKSRFRNEKALRQENLSAFMALHMLQNLIRYSRIAKGLILEVRIMDPEGMEIVKWTPSNS